MSRRRFIIASFIIGLAAIGVGGRMSFAQNDVGRQSEQQRIAIINKVKPSVVAVFAPGGRGGGSGVIISPEGYALTNFHVVQPTGPLMQCGLADGILYDAVIVGIDKVGDVALIRLLPKEAGKPFPFSVMGDSDKVKAGDWSLAMGNPFLLATDFTPTVTYGLISGTNRYQYPEGGGLLEYTDCIQIDTSINPGNSGGPLFNMNGELIGINGRGSFDKRSRINSGVGYAISINQIKNFLGHLKAGLDTDHATLGARVETMSEDADLAQMVVREVLEDSDAFRRGLDAEDELVSFAGRPVTSVNQYKNILGIYPKEWRLPLLFRRGNEKKEILVRLQSYQPQVITPDGQPMDPMPKPNPMQPKPAPVNLNSPAGKLYVAKKGFANFYFNELESKRVMASYAKAGDFSKLQGDWIVTGTFEMADRKGDMLLSITDTKDADDVKTVVKLKLNVEYDLEPLRKELPEGDLLEPTNSGGLMVGFYNWRRLMTVGSKGFEGGFSHGGNEPFYPMPIDGSAPKNFKEIRVDTEVIRTEHASVDCKWYFGLKDQRLLGFETYVGRNQDPCEVYFHDYKAVDGRMLPHSIEVRHGDKRYALLKITKYQRSEAK